LVLSRFHVLTIFLMKLLKCYSIGYSIVIGTDLMDFVQSRMILLAVAFLAPPLCSFTENLIAIELDTITE
jgi:hypothetical protein